jgi:ADP-ribosylglycohydrolase
MRHCWLLVIPGVFGIAAQTPVGDGPRVAVPVSDLQDKVRGGLLGQILGNLNGLPHEFRYIEEPGNVDRYQPALPEGARTDDDTDLEWAYVVALQHNGTILLPPERIVTLWRDHINDRIWCANLYARRLMDLGIEPPHTGCPPLNPWSDFNISGQFVSECFGLIAPGMPRTAARIGLHYTRVTIDGEPAQTTQLFTAMIASAYLTEDLGRILAAGLAAVDSRSTIHGIVTDVRRWHREHPSDWRATRRHIRDAYTRHGGTMRDRNGYELNTAATIAALLYGGGDFTETLRLAFNFGWDADNTAATSGTILGVIHGERRLRAHAGAIGERYRNTSRPGLPDDETIARFGDRLVALAERVIRERGGERLSDGGRDIYRIPAETPANVEPLTTPAERGERLREELHPQIRDALAGPGSERDQARAAYMAIALGLDEPLRREYPTAWQRAVTSLQKQSALLQTLAESDIPAAAGLRQRATAAGAQLP